MRRIAAVGLFLVLFLPWDIAAAPQAWKSKRSIDMNDVSQMHQFLMPHEVTSYHLELEPDTDTRTFKGRVRIGLTLTSTDDTIKLNADRHLEITEYSIRQTELSPKEKELGLQIMELNIAKVERSKANRNVYSLHLQQILDTGSSCEVDLRFSGNMTTNATSGLFYTAYIDSDMQEHHVVGTYFRPNNAKKMFPCLDQPRFKANFKLSILHRKDMIARANMPLNYTSEAPGQPDMIWSHFEEAPKIATYQVALLVSDLESLSPTDEVNEADGRQLDIKVWGRKEYLESLSHVPNKVVRIVNYLQEYFNSSFGLPKLDVIAVPGYSAAKASDSWGLMFFKESELSSRTLWNTAYELIYQWIGQYISPSGWAYGLANNALNSFLASMTTFDLDPNEMEGKWPLTILYSLYYELGKTVPFSRVAGIHQEAGSAYAEIVFRMLNYTLGKDLFQQGVQKFIREQSEKEDRTFFAGDICNYLDAAASGKGILPPDLTILNLISQWLARDRIPLVTAIRDYENKTITLSQKVYLREPPPASTLKVALQWDIPIVMVSQDNLRFDSGRPTAWLRKSVVPTPLVIENITDSNNFIIVNPEEIGIFPVNYDPCNWIKLSQYLQTCTNRDAIPVLTRAKLLHDSWNLAYSGELDFEIALNMTLFLKVERSHVVWEPVFTMFDHVGRRIESSDVYPKFEAYIRTLLKPLYEELGETGQPDDPSWKAHLRGLAKSFLCRAGYKPCIKEARDQYKKWLTDEDPDKGIPVANEFICPVFKWGTKEEWEFGLQRVINFPQHSPERKQNERTYLLKTLASCPKDTWKIERLLNVTILNPNSNFTDSDIRLIFSMLTGGAAGYTTLFKFLANHWDIIKEKFEHKKHLWDGIVNSATSSFNTEEGFEMVMQLYSNHRGEFDSAESIIHEALTIIKQETEWSKKNLPVIDSWLNENLSEEELEAIRTSSTTTPDTNTEDTSEAQ